MGPLWKAWIIYLFVADFLAAIGLWLCTDWGVGLFLVIAASQLFAYVGFPAYFGNQTFLIWFHLITVGLFLGLSWAVGRGTRSSHVKSDFSRWLRRGS